MIPMKVIILVCGDCHIAFKAFSYAHRMCPKCSTPDSGFYRFEQLPEVEQVALRLRGVLDLSSEDKRSLERNKVILGSVAAVSGGFGKVSVALKEAVSSFAVLARSVTSIYNSTGRKDG